MNVNKWTLGLASVGMISLASAAKADETPLSPVLTKVASTTLSGYVDFTASWTPGEGNATFPGRVYDGAEPGYNHDGFNLNVVSLTLNKPIDEEGWSAGYNVQALIGPGANKRGTGSIIGGSTGDIALNEAYISLNVPVGNGILLKAGQFGTFNGYEAYDTYKNPNWSRSYGFGMEASAHTGLAASYVINDMFSAQVGIGNTVGNGTGSDVDGITKSESFKTYLAMLTFTAPESFGSFAGATLTGGITTGAEGTALPSANDNHTTQVYVGSTLPLPVTGLSLGLAYDYTDRQDNGDLQANAFAAYLSYQATEKLKINGRFDYTVGDNGFWYGAPGTSDDELFAVTVTFDYSLWKNVISRAEVRWDHALEGDPFGGSRTGAAANDDNALTLTANLIYLF